METESSHCLGVTITFIALFQQIYTIGVASFLSLSCTNVETTITHLTIHNFVRIWPDQVPSYKLWPFSTIPKNQPQKGFVTKFSSINLLCKFFAFQIFHTKFSCSNFMFQKIFAIKILLFLCNYVAACFNPVLFWLSDHYSRESWQFFFVWKGWNFKP